jgi:hypothetical protein
VAYYKKALFYNWHYADAMYNLGVAYGEMLNFEMVSYSNLTSVFGFVPIINILPFLLIILYISVLCEL